MTKSFITLEGGNSSNCFADVTPNCELKVTDISGGFPYGATQVQMLEGFNSNTDKINYTVPTNKVFFITGWTVTLWDGRMQIVFRIDGTVFDGVGLNKNGSTFVSRNLNPKTPIATAIAGQVIDVYRQDGDSGKVWFCSIQGYLEDA